MSSQNNFGQQDNKPTPDNFGQSQQMTSGTNPESAQQADQSPLLSLADVRNIFNDSKRSFDKNLEDVECLQRFNETISMLSAATLANNSVSSEQEAQEGGSSSKQILSDPAMAKFIFTELIPGVARRAVSHKTTNVVFANLIADTLHSIVSFYNIALQARTAELQAENQNKNSVLGLHLVDLTDAMRYVFDQSKKFYNDQFQANLMDSEQSLAENAGQGMQLLDKEEREWREKLSVGDHLDVLKHDLNFQVKHWTQGRVQAFIFNSQQVRSLVKIKFLNDITVQEVTLPLDSPDIAKKDTNSHDFQWREDLKKGMLVDAMDKGGTWWQATVIIPETRIQHVMPMIKIGFRQYSVHGDKSDDMGSYFGMSQQLDEHIGAFTNRIQKAGTYAIQPGANLGKKTSEVQSISGSDQKEIREVRLQDDADMAMLKEEGEIIYATERLSCKSQTLVQLLTEFGQADGFDKLLTLINHQETSLEHAYYILDWMAKCNKMFHRSFVLKFFQSLSDAVQNKVLNASEAQLRQIKKERIDSLVICLWEKLMSRIYSSTEVQIKKQVFNLDIGISFLRQNFLEKRIEGAKYIDSVCKLVISGPTTLQTIRKQGDATKDLTQPLIDKLIEKQVNLEFFSKKNIHTQLVQRSAGFLKLVFKHDALKNEEIIQIFDTVALDEEIQIQFFKVLQDGVAGYMNPQIQELLLQKIGKGMRGEDSSQISSNSMRTEEIFLMEEMATKAQAQSTPGHKAIAQQVMDLLWFYLFDKSQKDNDRQMAIRAQGAFIDILKQVQLPTAIEYISRCVDNLRSANQGFLTCRILSRFFDVYQVKTANDSTNNADPQSTDEAALATTEKLPKSRVEFLDYVESKFDLLDLLFQELKIYMEEIQKYVKETVKEEDIHKTKTEELYLQRFNHKEEVRERCNLIANYASNNSSYITLPQLELFWKILISDNQMTEDNTILYKWLRSACDAIFIQNKKMVDKDEFIQFFKAKMDPSQTFFASIGLEGYYCLQKFFVLFNKMAKRLVLMEGEAMEAQVVGGQRAAKMTSFSNTEGASFKSYSFETETKNGAVQTTHVTSTRDNTGSNNKEPDDTQIDFFVKAPPNEMEGIEGLWKIAMDCRDQFVGKKVTALLLKLYTDVDFGMEDQIPKFEDQFIQKCFNIINEQSVAINNRSKEEHEAFLKAYDDIPGTFKARQKVEDVLLQEEKRIIRSLTYIQMLVKNSERDGTWGLRCHSGLKQGKYLSKINIVNLYKTGMGYRNMFEIQAYSNLTIQELKKLIAFELSKKQDSQGLWTFDFPPPHVGTIRIVKKGSGKTIEENENGCTLSELCFSESEQLQISLKSYIQTKKVPLMNEEKTDINARAYFIFGQLFDMFAIEDPDGIDSNRGGSGAVAVAAAAAGDEINGNEESTVKRVMTNQQVAQFIWKATNNTCAVNDSRVHKFFEFDDDNDGKLTKENFIEFYRKACLNGNQTTVRNNLMHYNYTDLLTQRPLPGQNDNIAQARKCIDEMPRYKIANDENSLNALFPLLNMHKEVQENAQKTINLICTNYRYFWKALYMKDPSPIIQDEFQWEHLFGHKDETKIAYCMDILDSFLTTDLSVFDPNTDEPKLRVTWVTRFIQQGGFDQFVAFANKSLDALINEPASEKYVSLVEQTLAILKILVTAAIQSTKVETDQQDQSKQQQSQTQSPAKPKPQQQQDDSEFPESSYSSPTKTNGDVKIPFVAFVDDNNNYVEYGPAGPIAQDQGSSNNNNGATFNGQIIDQNMLFNDGSNDDKKDKEKQASKDNENKENELDRNTVNDVTATYNPLEEFQRNPRYKQIINEMAVNNLASKVLDTIDFSSLQNKLLNVLSYEFMTKFDNVVHNRMIFSSLTLVTNLLIKKPELIREFYGWTAEPIFPPQIKATSTSTENKEPKEEPVKEERNIQQVIKYAVFTNKVESVRRSVKRTFELICEAVQLPDDFEDDNILQPLEYMLKTLIEIAPSKLTEAKRKAIASTQHYFDLLCALVGQYHLSTCAGEAEDDDDEGGSQPATNAVPADNDANKPKLIKKVNIDLMELLTDTLDQLKVYESNEQLGGLIEDRTLLGYLNLARELLLIQLSQSADPDILTKINDQTGLLDEVFYENLYFKPGKTKSKNGNKCKVFKNRGAAYKLLYRYIKALSPEGLCKFYEEYLWPMIEQQPTPPKWVHRPSAKSRKLGFAGIINLGCICYMNSMLQQCFMVPQFRNLLLQAQLPEDEVVETKEYKGRMIQDNLLIQVQRLFAFLQTTQRQAYDPTDLTFAYKDFDNLPTNVAIQCDCQEFLNLFFDRLEQNLAKTQQKYLLQDTFRGSNITQRKCKECGYTKSSNEHFYNLSVGVQNTENMKQALEKLISAQEINDYQCDGCKKKVDVESRTIIGETPNVLFVHLQRIIFSFETFNNEKINTKFEFPHTLDLRPYSYKGVAEKENIARVDLDSIPDDDEGKKIQEELERYRDLEDESFFYKLVGVTIHVGSADHGHYYALINSARGKAEKDPEKDLDAWMKTDQDRWYRFDDEDVNSLYFKELDKEAYGGDQQGLTQNQIDAFLATSDKDYGKSAYMLVYESRKKKQIRQLDDPNELTLQRKISFKESPEITVPQHYLDQVQKDNTEFVLDNAIYAPQFFNFIKLNLILSAEHFSNMHLATVKEFAMYERLKELNLEMGWKVMSKFLSRFSENASLAPLSSALQTVVLWSGSHVSFCSSKTEPLIMSFIKKHFHSDSCDYLFQLMFNCPDAASRLYCAKTIAYVFNRAFSILAVLTKSDNQEEREHPRVLELYKIMDDLMKTVFLKIHERECQKNWSRLEHYFTLLHEVGTGGQYQTEYLLKNYDYVVDICDVMLGSKSPKAQFESENRISMGGTVSMTPFEKLVALASHLVRAQTTKTMIPKEGDAHGLKEAETYVKFKAITGDLGARQKEELKIETYYNLSDEAFEYFTNPDLIQFILLHGFAIEAYGKALVHLCFNNYKLSKSVCRLVLRNIVNNDYDKIKDYISIVGDIVSMEECEGPNGSSLLQRKRLEWIFGFPFLTYLVSSSHNKEGEVEGERLKLGLESSFHNIKDEIYMSKSMLTYDPMNDNSLLHLLWRYQGRMDTYVNNCLEYLGFILQGSPSVMEYFSNLPGVSYQYARYTDWIAPYLLKQYKNANSSQYPSTYHANIANVTQKVIKLMADYYKFLNQKDETKSHPEDPEAILLKARQEAKEQADKPVSIGPKLPEEEMKAAQEAEIIDCKPQPYIIVRAGSQETYIHTEENDGVLLSISFVDAQWIESKPTGLGNKAVCDKWANKFQPQTITASSTYGSKSAASMLAEHDRQTGQASGGQASPKFGGNGASQPQESEEAAAIRYEEGQNPKSVIDWPSEQDKKDKVAEGNDQKDEEMKTDIDNKAQEGRGILDDSFEEWQGSTINRCHDLLYKLTVSNTRQEPIKYKIKLSEASHAQGQNINLHWPRTGIKGTLDCGQTEVVCVLRKIEPVDNLGISEIEKLKIELKWKLNEEKLKQIAAMGGGSSQTGGTSALRNTKNRERKDVRFAGLNVVTTEDAGVGGSNVSTPTGADINADMKPVVEKSEIAPNVLPAGFDPADFGGADFAEKACPICTFLNAPGLSMCEMCGSKL